MTMNAMARYKQEFIDFIVRKRVISFGDYLTKSGRKTPYFINMGNICNGHDINKLGEFYADAINENLNSDFDNLLGPAYKGIPLVVSAAVALEARYGKSVTFTYNRKEAKDHGEKGIWVGHPYGDGDRVVILEDVITAGTSVYESVGLLKSAAKTQLKALVVAVDRQEKGKTGESALREIQSTLNITTVSITSIDEIVSYLGELDSDGMSYFTEGDLARVQKYRTEYGA